MSREARIRKLESAFGLATGKGSFEVHSTGGCARAPGCRYQPCDHPGHEEGCHKSVRGLAHSLEDLVRVYIGWPCTLT